MRRSADWMFYSGMLCGSGAAFVAHEQVWWKCAILLVPSLLIYVWKYEAPRDAEL